MKGAEAAYEQTDAQLQNQLMDKRTQAAQVSSQYQTAKLTLETPGLRRFGQRARLAMLVDSLRTSSPLLTITALQSERGGK